MLQQKTRLLFYGIFSGSWFKFEQSTNQNKRERKKSSRKNYRTDML